MVSDVRYVAADQDHALLLDHLGEPALVVLAPWSVMSARLTPMPRQVALETTHGMVVDPSLGDPGDERLVDSNSSPVPLWQPRLADAAPRTRHVSSSGSQADTASSISTDHQRRVQGWVVKKGMRISGLEDRDVRPDLDVDLPSPNSGYALPGAPGRLEPGRVCHGGLAG